MDDYQYDCTSAELDELAHVITDLFPEQTRFSDPPSDDGTPSLVIHWIAMRFGATARRMTFTVRFDKEAFARYRAQPARVRGRGFAVLRAYVEATLGSLEEQYAEGQTVPREVEIVLGDEFA